MKISKISAYTCNQPLKIPFELASSGRIDHLVGVYVKIETDEGFAGFGEVRGNCHYFTGDIPESVVNAVKMIAPRLIGKDPENRVLLHQLIESTIVGNMAAKDAIDCAVYDLCGKIEGKPVWQILGGKIHDILPSEENIPFMSVEEAQENARRIIAQGSRFIKVRVGHPSLQYDLDRVKAIWEVICDSGYKDEIVYSADANRAWDTWTAIRAINMIREYGVTIIEQPMWFESPTQCRILKDNISMQLFGDESIATVNDFVKWSELGIIDGIHIKLIKCGGITNAVRLMHLCEAHGIAYMIGGMDEGMLAVAQAVAVAATADTTLFEVHGHTRIGKDPVSGLRVDGSFVHVPDGPGFGVEVDESALTLRAVID